MEIRERLALLEETLSAKVDGRVQDGPFEGMKLVRNSSWYGGQILPKLLGVYEFELFGDVERMIYNSPDIIINIGCAEGYYAVGFAKRIPAAKVYAFDIDIRGLHVCEENAKANGVEASFYFQTRANEDALRPILNKRNRTVMFVDCEGGERQIFEDLPGDLITSSMIAIECHDFVDEGVTQFLEQKLLSTHVLHFVKQQDRALDDIELLSDCPEDLRPHAVSEERPVRMHWLLAYPRDSLTAN